MSMPVCELLTTGCFYNRQRKAGAFQSSLADQMNRRGYRFFLVMELKEEPRPNGSDIYVWLDDRVPGV